MAEQKKDTQKKKKVRTREQEDRNYRRLWTFLRILFFLPFPFKAFHRERIPEGPCIVCPNHNSLADPPLACFAMGVQHSMRIMAKKSLMDTPIMGWAFDACGTFGVDRGNNDVGAIKNALRALKDGYKLLMFPEGTRVASDTQGDAKTGAVMLAMKTGVPLLPMFMTRKKRLFRRSTIIIGEPYYVKAAGKRPTKEELNEAADELLRRIYALEEETKR